MQIEQFYSGAWLSKWARLALVLFGLFLAVLYDVVFWKKELGFGLLLFVIIYVVGFFYILVLDQFFTTKEIFVASCPTVSFERRCFFSTITMSYKSLFRW